MPPLTPLPPTSMPNPRRWGPRRRFGRAGVNRWRSSALLGEAGRCDAHHTLVASEISSRCAVRRHRSGTVLRCARDRQRHRSRPAALGRRAAGRRRRPSSCARRRAEVFGDAARTPARRRRCVPRAPPPIPVTVVDTETERLLRDRLAELRPGEPVLGEEEGGPTARSRRALTWVLDPIDGTVNFVYGIEAYAVSVGVQRDGVSVAGAVAERPRGRAVLRRAGHGAHVQRGWRHDTAAVQCRRRSVDGVGGHRLLLRARPTGTRRPRCSPAAPGVRDVRRIGSCALDLCMVAAGGSTPTTRTASTCGTGRPAR